MKKLIAMIGAAAMAFGLYAEEPENPDSGFLAGTAFEADDGGNSWNSGDGLATGFWVNYQDVASVIEGQNAIPRGSHPAKFSDVGDTQVIKIATTLGNPVLHNVKSTGGTQDIGTGLYFDGLVKFTLFDPGEEPAAEDAKIAVYPLLESDDGDAYLTVLAKGANGEPARYTTATKIAADTWYRLTIKAIADIDGNGQTGFMVFVNGNAANDSTGAKIESGLLPKYAEWGMDGKIFRSMVASDATVKAVGFDGKGEVDEIAFTTTAPSFAVDPTGATVGWNTTKVRGISLTEGGELLPATPNPAFVALSSLTDGKVYYKAVEGYVDGCITVADGDTPTIGTDVDAAAAAVNGVAFAEFTDADEALADADAGATLKLFAKMADEEVALSTDKEFILELNNVSIGDFETAASAVTIKGPGAVLGALSVDGALTIDGAVEFFDFTEGYAAIATPADLSKLAKVVNAGYATANRTFKQTDNIDMTSAGTFPGIGVYKNNGGSAAAFKGVYDGDNKTISNVTIAPAKYQGLFAQVEGGTVKNLTVDTVTFDWVANYATEVQGEENKKECVFVEEVGGAMCVSCLVDGTVENVTTKGSFGSSEAPLTASAGGVVNRICAVNAAVNITSCTNEAAMYTAGAKAAGIAIINQKAEKTVTISDCVNKGAINFVDKGLRTVDKATAETTGKCDTAGGYAGVIAHTIAITINNCSNEGTITVAEKAITDGACIGQIIGHVCAASGFTVTGCKGTTTQVAYVSKENGPITTLDFATVADDVATYVAAPTLGGSFLVTSEKAAYEFTAAGTITFDNSLVQGFAPTADTEQFILTNEGSVWTCSVKPTTYGITITTPQNGTLETSVTNGVAAGTSVKVTATPAAGYELDELTVKIMPAAFPVAVGQDGTFTMPEGNVTVLATFKAIAVSSIDVAVDGGAAAEVDVEKTLQLKATVNPTTALTKDVTWTSADATIATVDQTGLVTGVAAGTVKIIATATDGSEVKGELEITVKAAGPVYPQDLPDDPVIQGKYAKWAADKAGKTIENPDAPEVMEAFLLDCALDQVAAAKANFKITSITQDAEGNWIVKVTGEKGEGAEYGNGFVEIVPYEGIDVGDNGELFQAKLVLQLPTKGE